jgi:hypothetical protein
MRFVYGDGGDAIRVFAPPGGVSEVPEFYCENINIILLTTYVGMFRIYSPSNWDY